MRSFVLRAYGLWFSLLLSLSSALYANSFYISDVSETTEDNAPALVIRFTDAIDPDTDLADYISVNPFPDTGSVWLPQNGGRQWLLPFVEPSTEYHIAIIKPPLSINGERLLDHDRDGNPRSFEQKVTTRQLQPGATFASSGSFLVGDIQNGLPVTVVNQPAIDLDVFRVREDEVNRFLNESQFQGRKYYSQLNRINRYADLVHSARFENNARRNQRTTYNLNLDPVLEQHENGLYVAVLRMPGEYEGYYDTTFFTITDIGLHARKYQDSLMLYSNSIATGEALAGVELTFWWPKTTIRASREQGGRTSTDGSFELATNDLPRIVIARQGKQISYLKLNEGALDLSDYPNVPSLHRAYQMFFYGPRDLYRPGEQVAINMLLRDYDGQKVRNMPVKASLYDARGERKKQFTWQPQGSSVYQTHYQLDSNAATGTWRLTVQSFDSSYTESYQFQVEEFLPETLTLSFYDGDRRQIRYAPRSAFNVPIQGDYLYGAPAAGNTADAIVTVAPASHPFPKLKSFYFGDANARVNEPTYRIDEIKLDANGQGQLTIPNRWSSNRIPLRFSIAASIYESGGRPITRTQTVFQLPEDNRFAGVEPQFKGRPASNQKTQFKLLSVDQHGQPVNDRLAVRLLRNYREYYWQYDDSRGWHWDYDSHNYVIASTTVNVTTDGAQLVEFPLEWGEYELEVMSESGAKTRYRFNTLWSWSNQNSTSLKPDHLQLSLDQDAYQAGDTAQLRLTSPVAGNGIINVESTNGVIYSARYSIDKGDNSLNLTIPAQWNRHDLYLTAMVISPANQVSEVAPKRALGIIHLPLKRADAEAIVELSTAEKITPNQTINAHLKVTNLAELGNQKLYATVALVDKGVLNITNYQPPKPEDYFFAPRRFEASYYDIYGKIINNLGYQTLHQRFGGDMFADSDAELSRGGDKPKTEVQIVSFFSDPMELVNGEADVSFELPSFNGKLAWMVVVFGERSYGSASAETTVADRLVTQIAMPRFLAMGDRSQLSIDLHNLSDADQVFDVKVNVSGALSGKGLQQSVTLADKEKTVLTVPVTGADAEGQGLIELQVSNGTDINITRSWRLGVRSPYPWITEEVRTVIEPGQSWQPTLELENLRVGSVQAMLTVSNRPAINFRSELSHLLRYPYGCLEQTTSSTYPWLLMNQKLVEQLDLSSALKQRFGEPYSELLRVRQLRKGIERLKAKQLDNGGFGYWNASSSESRWGTVYATELLVDTRNSGLKVDEAMLNKAMKRLQYYVRNSADRALWSDSFKYFDFAHRAYAAFVLAKADNVSLSHVRRLYDQAMTENPDQSGLAWMHLAGALSELKDRNRAKTALRKALYLERKGLRYYRDYGSTLRDDALSLAIALELGLNEGQLADRMVTALRNKRWVSTQERLALAKVARQYADRPKAWQARLETTQGDQTLNQDSAFSSVFEGNLLRSLQTVAAVDQKLYVSLQYQGAPVTPPAPSSQGLRVWRSYFNLNGNAITPTTLTSGELIVVRLEVAADNDLRVPDALLVELLPAGLELENQNLSNASVDLDSIQIEDESLGSYFREPRVQYQEYRDDRYVAALEVSYWRTSKVYYLARAVTPGTYQVAPTLAEDMYRPQYRALSTTLEQMTILPR